MGRGEGTDGVEVLHEWAEMVGPLHAGCENKDSSEMLSLEQWHSTGGKEAAAADQRRAVVPGQLGLRLPIPAGEVTLPGTWWALTKYLSNEWMDKLVLDLGQVV